MKDIISKPILGHAFQLTSLATTADDLQLLIEFIATHTNEEDCVISCNKNAFKLVTAKQILIIPLGYWLVTTACDGAADNEQFGFFFVMDPISFAHVFDIESNFENRFLDFITKHIH